MQSSCHKWWLRRVFTAILPLIAKLRPLHKCEMKPFPRLGTQCTPQERKSMERYCWSPISKNHHMDKGQWTFFQLESATYHIWFDHVRYCQPQVSIYLLSLYAIWVSNIWRETFHFPHARLKCVMSIYSRNIVCLYSSELHRNIMCWGYVYWCDLILLRRVLPPYWFSVAKWKIVEK